jgi:hypothetical protein
MPSPFPGMDPYLEDPAYRSGFHTRYVVALSAALTRVLPAGYYADVEQHVGPEGDGPDDREPFAVPDASVARDGASRSGGTAAVATVPTTEVTLPKPAKRKGPKFVRIAGQPGNRVVRVIEVLSPSNKDAGEDRDNDLRKRDDYLLSGTNLVEIDLLRDGERVPFGRPKPPPADYYVLISRADRFPMASVWAATVRDPLPVLPVPLKPEHGEVPPALRECLDRAYDDAGYDTRIDYSAPPAVPLRKPDAEWAAELLTTSAKKKAKK